MTKENTNINKVAFTKEKIAAMQRISKELLNDITIKFKKDEIDYLQESLTIELYGFVYSTLAEERTLRYHFDRPTFLDWFLRRKRTASFNLKVKDLLLNAPKIDNTIRTYVIYED